MTDWNLKKHPRFAGVKGPVVVCVMDGVGLGKRDPGDAVYLARTPTLDALGHLDVATQLKAHGTAVGMPSDADMGNSEVGHNALGAGRVFDQGAKLVENAIADGSLFEGAAWKHQVKNAVANRQPMHFLGLLSDGNVHSHIDHLEALIKRCDAEAVRDVRVHVLLDGRDVPETSCPLYVERLEALLSQISQSSERDYRIASGGGRMTTTMDRYGADWSMVERGYRTHVHGVGPRFGSAMQAIESMRAATPGIGDQNLGPFVIVDDAGQPVGPIRDGASVVFFNFRGDRAMEISTAFEADDFDKFDRGARPQVSYAGMMEYDGDLHIPSRYLVSPPVIEQTLGEYLARNGVTQLAISETQKFGHVTYFWNGNRSGKFDDARETYIEIRSDNVPFEQRPWMKAAEITDALITELQGGTFRHARLNYANGDMVGHTGSLDAAIIAVEVVDLQLARLLPVIERLEGALIVTADHGNADEMFEKERDASGHPRPKTSHTLNPVPFFVYAPSTVLSLDKRGIASPGLSNVAGTVTQLLGLEAPAAFEPGLLAI